LTVGLRSGLRPALIVTALSVGLYAVLIVVAAPHEQAYYIVMRAAYIAITGYLVGFLGQERINQEARIRELESNQQREQIARSLHDGYAQALAGVNLRLETCRQLLQRESADDAMQELTELQRAVNREHDELRSYIRSLVDMDKPLPSASDEPTPSVSVSADFRGSARLVEHALLIMLEGLRNIRRHARARTGSLEARLVEHDICLTIADDGVGFPNAGEAPWSMRSRVAECGGSLALENSAQGARLRIALPAA
jgi:signal transduction histidine kinase